MKKLFKSAILMTLVLCMLFSSALAAGAPNARVQKEELTEAEALYNQLLDMADFIAENGLNARAGDDWVRNMLIYLFEKQPEAFEELVNMMFQSHDIHSYYLSPEVYEDAYNMSNEIIGVGVVFEDDVKQNLITSVIPGGPADRAGIQGGDVVVSVDGVNCQNMPYQQIVSMIRGEQGTEVTIEVLRRVGEPTLEFSLFREKITISTVSGQWIEESRTYVIKVTAFNWYETFDSFATECVKADWYGAENIVIDLRGNLGGDIYTGLDIINLFIEKGGIKILTVADKNGNTEDFYSFDGPKLPDHLYILVNERTASTSEFVTGALQDLGRAKVIGTGTYGKGVVQAHLTLENYDVAVLTIWELLLPVSGAYHGKGITPDYVVKNELMPREMPNFTPYTSITTLFKDTSSQNVRAFKQRLAFLGYSVGDINEVCDQQLIDAANSFCRRTGMKEYSGFISVMAIDKLEQIIEEARKTIVEKDRQMEFALSLALKNVE